MGTNVLSGTGLVFSRNLRAASPTYQGNFYTVKKGYATAIGIGDVVQTGTGSNLGYVIVAPDGASRLLGAFLGVAHPGYYDTSLQAQAYGLNGSWPTTANPSGDVSVCIGDDPGVVWRVQVSGGPWAQSWRGKNIDWLAASNGAPNISGVSSLVLDANSIGTTNTLPFRIVDVVGVSGGPMDPANTNPWIEVSLNTAEAVQSGGI